MVSVNKVLFAGNLTADPVSQAVGNGQVCRFSLANTRKWTSQGQQKEEVTFVDCEAWAKVGEVAQNYLKKGRPVLIEGRLKLDRWTTPDGQSRQKIKVNVETVQFLDSAQGGAEQAAQEPQQVAPAQAYNPDDPF